MKCRRPLTSTSVVPATLHLIVVANWGTSEVARHSQVCSIENRDINRTFSHRPTVAKEIMFWDGWVGECFCPTSLPSFIPFLLLSSFSLTLPCQPGGSLTHLAFIIYLLFIIYISLCLFSSLICHSLDYKKDNSCSSPSTPPAALPKDRANQVTTLNPHQSITIISINFNILLQCWP